MIDYSIEYQDIRGHIAERLYGKQYNKFCKQPRPKMQRYAFGDEKAIRASPSGHFEADASQCHLLRKCHEIRKNVLMKVNFQRPFPRFQPLSNLFGQANKSAGWMPWH